MKTTNQSFWRKKIHILFSMIFFFSINSNVSFSGENSFQIAPAPVPYPVFEAGKKDAKFTAVYVGMSGSGVDLSGGGFNISGRTVLEKSELEGKGAIDAAFGFFALSGDPEFTLVVMNPQANFEYQFIKEEKYSLIGFAGFTVPIFFGSIINSSNGIFGYSYGVPFGVQGGYYPHKDWTIAPFFMINWIFGGSVTTGTNTVSMDGYFAPSFGADVIYEPYDISLGTLLQQADGGGTAGGIKTTIIQVSWQKTF